MPRIPSRFRAGVPLLVLLALGLPAQAGEDCSKLARQLKMDALDQLWGAVQEDAEKLLGCDPRGPNAMKARFYRARALDRLRRREQGVEAYQEFLTRHCRFEDSDSILCQDARVSRFALVRELVARTGSGKMMDVLVGGLKTGDFYSRIFAGIQISQLPGAKEAKTKAVDVLVEAYRLEEDPDFRNEICLAIIRIDPTKCGGVGGAPGTDQAEPSFIKARVFDCNTNTEKVKVNLPFSFAKAVIESLGPELMDGIRAEGFDLENLWASLKKMDSNQIFKIEINDEHRCEVIEVWFE